MVRRGQEKDVHEQEQAQEHEHEREDTIEAEMSSCLYILCSG